METFKVLCFTFAGGNEVVLTGLTLDEAREHCKDPATSGDGWFHGYESEGGCISADDFEQGIGFTECYGGDIPTVLSMAGGVVSKFYAGVA